LSKNKCLVSIVIPSWNGKALLQRFLTSVIKACKSYDGESEIIIIDDGSTDGTEGFICKNYPQVMLIRLPSNQGFSHACNLGMKEARGDIVVLLNNDMLVDKDFLMFLPEPFKNEKVFGVRPGLKWLDDKTDFDFNSFFIGLKWKWGLIELPMLKVQKRKSYPYISCISGGAGAFDRKKWLEIGGFDESFSPFYYEDADISYRAWKRGWIILYEPRSHVYHLPSSTIRRLFSPNCIEEISERNRYFLVWKNIWNPLFILHHLFFIPLRILISFLPAQSYKLKGFLLALKRLNRIIEARNREKECSVRTDREIFDLFSSLMKGAKPWP
jgi:GT2 family glycosyltransferase